MNEDMILKEVIEEAVSSEEIDNSKDDMENVENEESLIKPYYKNYYLLYGGSDNNLDIDGTSNFLKELGFGGGELQQAREEKEAFNAYKGLDRERSNQMFCSYCGLEITGVEYQRLPDGRLRCTNCSHTLVKSEMQELCDRVVDNMEGFFGAAINEPIHIEVLEERKLKRKLRGLLGDKDDKSILLLGVAVNSKKGYRIYIENGAPRISVIATLAHELTHIWQYINWDNKKGFKVCSKAQRLLIYEGMAKWVEIQYLYLIGETAVARREEYLTRRRDDEYGIGFKIFENEYPLSYGTIVCNESPFTKDRYPI